MKKRVRIAAIVVILALALLFRFWQKGKEPEKTDGPPLQRKETSQPPAERRPAPGLEHQPEPPPEMPKTDVKNEPSQKPIRRTSLEPVPQVVVEEKQQPAAKSAPMPVAQPASAKVAEKLPNAKPIPTPTPIGAPAPTAKSLLKAEAPALRPVAAKKAAEPKPESAIKAQPVPVVAAPVVAKVEAKPVEVKPVPAPAPKVKAEIKPTPAPVVEPPPAPASAPAIVEVKHVQEPVMTPAPAPMPEVKVEAPVHQTEEKSQPVEIRPVPLVVAKVEEELPEVKPALKPEPLPEPVPEAKPEIEPAPVEAQPVIAEAKPELKSVPLETPSDTPVPTLAVKVEAQAPRLAAQPQPVEVKPAPQPIVVAKAAKHKPASVPVAPSPVTSEAKVAPVMVLVPAPVAQPVAAAIEKSFPEVKPVAMSVTTLTPAAEIKEQPLPEPAPSSLAKVEVKLPEVKPEIKSAPIAPQKVIAEVKPVPAPPLKAQPEPMPAPIMAAKVENKLPEAKPAPEVKAENTVLVASVPVPAPLPASAPEFKAETEPAQVPVVVPFTNAVIAPVPLVIVEAKPAPVPQPVVAEKVAEAKPAPEIQAQPAPAPAPSLLAEAKPVPAPAPESKDAAPAAASLIVAQAETLQPEVKPAPVVPPPAPAVSPALTVPNEAAPPQPADIKQEVKPAPLLEVKKEAPVPAPPQEGLAEAEQLAFEKFGGDWEGPERFASERQALKYFMILMKGDHASVRWYQHYKFTQTDRAKRRIYGRDIATAVAALNPTRNREWLKLVSKVVKNKADYPEAVAGTCKVVGISHNQKAIPLMREALDHPVIFVKIQAAGALLTLGDVDTALPVLDDLTKEGKTAALGYVYHNLRGAKWQKRGIELLRKAQGYDDNETRGLATLFLISLKKKGVVKDDPKQLEVVLEKIGEEILERNKLAAYFSRDSDHRALEIIIRGFEQLGSKDAIPLLQRIAEHPEASYLRQRVDEAIRHLS